MNIDNINIKVKGENCPKPISSWAQCEENPEVIECLKKNGFERPTPMQAQALPIIMSGRDMIGIAKTGSGKTLAFLLPLFRHVLDQPALEPDDGPIGIIITPTCELATQITKEARKFTCLLQINVVCVYGGSSISEQIAELKRGCQIIVCTPVDMIDILAANNGLVTNLRRVSYVVLDEADRMFDLGFEPQVNQILDNVRPDKQTVMFSATFPKKMEELARKVLTKPVEVTVVGRSVVAKEVEQHVVVIDEEEKYFKLLELLEIYQEKGSVIVFVDKQENADDLVKNLLKNSYTAMALHGGVGQCDRESIMGFFKSANILLVATSIAARVLDVMDLILVVNYDCPNHYEDYVHRCGRTGRAGNQGFAYTFITPKQKRYAGHIIEALELSSATVPDELKSIWDEYVKEMEALDEQIEGSFKSKRTKKDKSETEKSAAAAPGTSDVATHSAAIASNLGSAQWIAENFKLDKNRLRRLGLKEIRSCLSSLVSKTSKEKHSEMINKLIISLCFRFDQNLIIYRVKPSFFEIIPYDVEEDEEYEEDEEEEEEEEEFGGQIAEDRAVLFLNALSQQQQQRQQQQRLQMQRNIQQLQQQLQQRELLQQQRLQQRELLQQQQPVQEEEERLQESLRRTQNANSSKSECCSEDETILKAAAVQNINQQILQQKPDDSQSQSTSASTSIQHQQSTTVSSESTTSTSSTKKGDDEETNGRKEMSAADKEYEKKRLEEEPRKGQEEIEKWSNEETLNQMQKQQALSQPTTVWDSADKIFEVEAVEDEKNDPIDREGKSASVVNTNTAASDKKSAAEKGAIMEKGQEAHELLTVDEELPKPVEVTVGGRSVVAMEVEQKKRKAGKSWMLEDEEKENPSNGEGKEEVKSEWFVMKEEKAVTSEPVLKKFITKRFGNKPDEVENSAKQF